ncbi:PD-(D/E)XK nuclease domain-containing protein [Peptococcaceae bacterium]|nr:PD-(D/E)XK nuclease domain-containing protein [Peptococcaceae bacterium]
MIKLIKEKKYFLPKLSNLRVDEKLLDVFDVDRIDIEVLLFQAGYLTIKDRFELPFGTEYELGFPNKEVKISFNDVILDYFLDKGVLEKKKDIYYVLVKADMQELMNAFKRVFASIPHTYWTLIKSYEGFYASIVYSHLQALGIDIIGEDVTNKGRIDLSVFIDDKTYIIEFKVITSEKEKGTALKQVRERKYHEKYLEESKEIYLVGMEFSENERNIVNFEWERV